MVPAISATGAPAMKYITSQENRISEAWPKSGCSASTTITVAATKNE